MPAIQAMRADALAMRSKEDIQEKVPSFYNSVNQALGNSIIKGQDAAEALITKRYEAANKILAELRQKLDGQGTLSEQGVQMTMKLVSSGVQTVRTFLSQTDVTDLARLATDLLVFNSSIQSLQEQWDAATATYAQWVVQAGYAGHGTHFPDPLTPFDANAPVTTTFTQILESGNSAPMTPGAPGSMTFTGINSSAIPSDLEVYDYITGNAPDVINVTVITALGSQEQQLMYSPTTDRFYVQVNSTVTGPPSSVQNVPRLSATVNWNGSGLQDVYTGTNNNTGQSVTRWVQAVGGPPPGGSMSVSELGGSVPPDIVIHDIDPVTIGNQESVIRINDTDTGLSGDYIVYESPSNPGVYYIQYAGPPISGSINATSGPDPATAGYIGNASNSGTLADTVTLGRNVDPAGMLSMGGRGAIMYRDALTPRWTDRKGWGDSDLGAGIAYDTYFAYGSVGSITRIGRGTT